MKKIKILFVIFILLSLGGYYMRNYVGLYFDFRPNAPITFDAKTEGKEIYVKDKGSREYKAFEVKGVEVASSIAGNYGTDYAVDKKTWLKWFKQIQDMGANTISVPTIYNDTFYNAFYEFNKDNKEKLFLFQGIQVSDYANNSSEDAYSEKFFSSLEKDSVDVIDVVHGRKIIALNKMKGSGNYRKDVSPWVLGYTVGNGWNSGTMAYTNNNNHETNYEGEYFKTTKNSTAFEAMLAKIMDGMVSYESKKYKTQRLISFFNDPQNDPFEYEKHYAKQLNKYNILDAENIKATDKLKTGFIASYRLYEFSPNFSDYFSKDQKLKIRKELKDLDKDMLYEGYTELLARYHSMPVMMTGYGFSSARGTDDINGPITEEEQGQALVSTHKDIVDSGCIGSIISTWQDTWERRSWNTSYAVNVKENFRWRDVQTDAQGYGLLSFDPGEKKSDLHVDGNSSEWNKKDLVLSDGGTKLSAKYDESFLYILLEKEGLTEKDDIYIPIDTTNKSGSKKSENPKLSFDRAADFIVKISGKENSKLLVQERYESLRGNYLMQTERKDPFVFFPDKDSSKFVDMKMICQNKNIISEELMEADIKAMKTFDTYETGKLRHGNSNPDSVDFNSLADFFYGNNFVEIRLPWQMLNFSNPSDMKIHDDYYENYGVEEIPISKLYLGVCKLNQVKAAKMSPIKLDGWHDRPTYHERLKKSYFILKEDWRS